MGKSKPKYVLKEPIDFKGLSEAYRKARWNWHRCGIPSPADLEKTIEFLRTTALHGSSGNISSVGITAIRQVENVILMVDSELRFDGADVEVNPDDVKPLVFSGSQSE